MHLNLPKKRSILLCIAACISLISPLYAAYEIRGNVNLSDEWQPQLFLSTINKLDDYYSANPEDIIQVSHINEDGSFAISGNNLPPEQRFYRLYLVKESNSEFDACLYIGGEDHNFIHLILDNNSFVEIEATPEYRAPFGEYQIKGDEANRSLQQLSKLVHPSFYFHQIKFSSELLFTQEKLNRDLFAFADSCGHPLVALAAMINTEMDKYHRLEMDRYDTFGERLVSELPLHNYTDDYLRKLNYYRGNPRESSKPVGLYFLLGILSAALILALLKIKQLQKQQTKAAQKEETPLIKPEPLPSFTPQEEKILAFILEGKTNKEIASVLFIELSTVKTHINKLYGKLGVKNRTEAKHKAMIISKLNGV